MVMGRLNGEQSKEGKVRDIEDGRFEKNPP